MFASFQPDNVLSHNPTPRRHKVSASRPRVVPTPNGGRVGESYTSQDNEAAT